MCVSRVAAGSVHVHVLTVIIECACGKPALITNQILYYVTGVQHGHIASLYYNMVAPIIYLYRCL